MDSTTISPIPATDTGAAAPALFDALYAELHELARQVLARRGADGAFGTTTLLHEAYLAIAPREGLAFPDRARFMGYAARVMRGLIIDQARSRDAQKRGSQFDITALSADVEEKTVDYRELVRISEALDELASVDPPLAEIVDLKFFCGLSLCEIGAMRDVSERTIQRHWEKARVYLHHAIRGGNSIA